MSADERPGPSGAARPSVAMIHWVNGRAYPGPPPPSPSAEAPPAPAGSPSPAPPPEPPP